ncbi:MAG: GNAT family N-acetyltransferase [Gemmatimonadales bacterium]|jgi:RimJ/RimL family protein N-acetyltransferase|nr:GNAT family N-acetyltransferase [Gemmatimonadales bacterium]
MARATLTSERLVLRPPRLEDAAAIYEGYACDPEVARFVIWTPHRSIRETQEFLTQFVALADGDPSFPWVMTLAADGAVIGAMHLRVHPPWAEFGFNIARPHWNRGFGTEAVRAVIGFGVGLPGIERIQAICHVDNCGSARVMEKAGMRREGVLRRYLVFPNLGERAQDVFMYSVTGDDLSATSAGGE